jgi:hypothetical protein
MCPSSGETNCYQHSFCNCQSVLMSVACDGWDETGLKLKSLPGAFQHSGLSRGPIVFLPQQVPHSSPEAPRIIQMRETYTSEDGNYPPILPVGLNFTRIPLGFFTCRKAGTWDILFYFPSEGRHTEDFSDARKIQRLRPGLDPRTRVPVASMLTTRPPKPSPLHENICGE